MTSDAQTRSRALGAELLKSLDKAEIGAAASKLVAASIGEIVAILSRSSTHKHLWLADIEWLVMPAVAAGQFYVVQAAHQEQGFRAPVAVVAWASASPEVDRRLEDQAGRAPPRLRPDEWNSGDIGWLVYAVGSPAGVKAGLQWLKSGPFKERALKLVARGDGGKAIVRTLDEAMAGPGAAAT